MKIFKKDSTLKITKTEGKIYLISTRQNHLYNPSDGFECHFKI